MSSGSRPSSPLPAQPSHIWTRNHEATLTVSANPSPVPPTPPPKDYKDSADPSSTSAAAAAMSKMGVKAAPPVMEEADSVLVIDISGPADESYRDPDSTLRVDGEPEEGSPRDSEETETDADITMTQRGAESPEQGGSTLHGSGAGAESERENVREHPLRLDIYPPSPPPWGTGEDGEDEYEDGEGETGRSGRVSPQRFVYPNAKPQRVHEFSTKPRIQNRPLIPHSAYYFGPPPPGSAYGTDPVGQIGVHHPREIVRIERDYTGGELPQFAAAYPLELEGRITPTQFLETINAMNEILLSAHSLGHAFVDNALAYFSLQLSRAIKKTHYEKEMEKLRTLIDELNTQMYNPVGLHIKWPHSVAFLFLEIEYY